FSPRVQSIILPCLIMTGVTSIFCYICLLYTSPPPPPLVKPTTAYEILRCLVGSEMYIRDRLRGT
ncbi:hypothetical protein ACX3V1_12330, partial [Escherichia coli]